MQMQNPRESICDITWQIYDTWWYVDAQRIFAAFQEHIPLAAINE